MKKEVDKNLKITENIPLSREPRIKTETNELSEVLRPIDKIIDTGKLLDNNKNIKDSDYIPLDELSDILSSEVVNPNTYPDIIDKSTLNDEDSLRLLSEERQRRSIENERRSDISEAYDDEVKRRKLASDKIKLMRDEFQLFAKNTYPSIVGERYIKNGDEVNFKNNIETRKKVIESSELELQQRKVNRLQREKLRKSIEAKFQINKLSDSEVQSFFENDVMLEYRLKLENNPEIENLSYVEKTLKDISDIESMLGRKIIPHRDIIESEYSDFETNPLTNSSDILVLTEHNLNSKEHINKMERLEKLRRELNSMSDDELYILKK